MSLRKRCMFEGRGLVRKLMRRKRLCLLGLKCEGILILKMMGSESVRIKAMKMTCRRGLTSMHAAF